MKPLDVAPGSLNIRRAQPEERKALEKLVRVCGKNVADYFAMRNTTEYWERGEVWLAEWGSIYVGFAVVHPLVREDVQSLYQVGVHPEWRGLKIATTLLYRAMEAHPSKPVLRLVVSEDNQPAIRMYEAWGLQRIDRKETRRNGFVYMYGGKPKWS